MSLVFDPALVREIRRQSGLSISDVAERAGCKRNMLLKVEVGSRRPSVALLLGIANALGVSPDRFCSGAVEDAPVASGKPGVGRVGLGPPPAVVFRSGGGGRLGAASV